MDEVERIVPEVILAGVNGEGYAPVLRVIAHPPSQHPESCPLVSTCTAVEVITEYGSRWFGTSKAWIGSDLRMHMMVNARDEVRRNWERPDNA